MFNVLIALLIFNSATPTFIKLISTLRASHINVIAYNNIVGIYLCRKLASKPMKAERNRSQN